MKLSELHETNNKEQCNNNRLNITIISNIIFEPYFNALLQTEFIKSKTTINVFHINDNEYKACESRQTIAESNLIIVCFNIESLHPNAHIDISSKRISSDTFLENLKIKCCEVYLYIKQLSVAPILWFGFEDYCYQYNIVNGNIIYCNNLIDKINNELYCMLKEPDIYLDLKRIIAIVGIEKAFDSHGKYRWNAPYSKNTINEICKEIHKQYLIYTIKSKKCIVLDCDNVLWGGILSEDGFENIVISHSGLGRPYQDFQRFMVHLYNCGVILAICSKNDLSDVMNVFNNHDEMLLKKEHIACFQVNWDNKANNICKIAETLNIGLDSIVFIDDSEFEIQSVNLLLPEITTIKFEYTTVYQQLFYFNLKSKIDIEKVNQRNNTYRTNRQRDELKCISNSFDDYLKALEMKVDIHVALPIEFSRITELTLRTNKYTNGMRYTVEQLKDNINSGLSIYSVFLSDKFSNLGLVGTFAISGETLMLFSLSCRAMGRKIENIMFQWILNNFQIKYIMFKSTNKNDNIKTILKQNFLNASIEEIKNN